MRGFRLSRPPRLVGRLVIAVVLVMAGLAYGYASRRAETAGRRLTGALLSERFAAGRLSGQTAWHACVPTDTAALVPRVRCGPPLDPGSRRVRRMNDLARATGPAAQRDSSPGALRRRALLDLRFADTTTVAVDRAVAALEQALRLAPGDAGMLNDLAVAQLAAAERTQALTPMLRALDAIERAAERDSLRPEILFNRALIRQRLYLVASAGDAWARYLAVERDPRWRAEAQAHARGLAQMSDTVSWNDLLTSPPAQMDAAVRARIAGLVERSPQGARDSSFVLLGAWGRAVERGDARKAGRFLALAREIGAAADSLGADHGVSLGMHAIDAAADKPARLADLASGHAALGDGYQLFYRSSFEQAAASLQRAEQALSRAGSPASRWAAFYYAAAVMNLGRFGEADSVLGRVQAQATRAEPGLAGKAVWARGVIQVRAGNHERASGFYREASPYIARAREPENQGTMAYLLAESLALSGQAHASRAECLRGLRLLSPYRRSNFLNNQLTIVASHAREDGLGTAALAVMNEVLHVAAGVGKTDVLARAHRARARDLVALGRRADALRELTLALRWAERGSGAGGTRVRADVMLVLGRLLRPDNPRAALAVLSDVVDAYRDVKIDMHIPAALYETGMAAEAAGAHAEARRHFREAIGYIDRQQASFESAEVRATFHETIENVFDAVIRLELAAGRPDSAFQYLERARTAIQPLPGQDSAAADPPVPQSLAASLRAGLPRDALFVDYALLNEQLVIWTASARGWKHRTISIPRDSIAELVKRFRREAGEVTPGAMNTRAGLYDLLVHPLVDELVDVTQLVVVPDRELYGVPFAALWNRKTGRYLVQDHQVTTVPSAAFYAAALHGPVHSTHTTRALVVGNPALDPAAASRLGTLPGAVREAREIAGIYPGSRLLTGSEADRGAVLQALPAQTIFHFAGHAVLNDEQPASSYLALASDSLGQEGELRGWEISRMRLSNVRVVVLSACSTLGPRPTRAGAAAGLAYSFLRAGAPATISTLWDVRDETTTPLLVAFHRQFSAGTAPAEALRRAQVQALADARAELRAPAAWAAFIYTGR